MNKAILNFLPVVSFALATLPIMAMNLAPKAHGDVLAIFDPTDMSESLKAKTHSVGLNIVTYDPDKKHMIVENVDGNAPKILYRLGAKLVVDADFSSSCRQNTSAS